MRITLTRPPVSFTAAPDQSVLDAARSASLNLPHSCRGGNCGSCRARLLTGEISYPNGTPLGLSAAEGADGFVLLCQARARSDLTLDTCEITTPEQASVKRMPARVVRAEALSHDVMRLDLKLPVAEAFTFQAGQYIDILLPHGRRRSFSIASPPHLSRVLELHIRRVAGGEFSAGLFERNARDALLLIEGPLGHFVYRPGGAPLLLVGGGTGIAPLLSIMRYVTANGIARPMTVYWGVRAARDLYADAVLRELAAAAGPAKLDYVPVLSEPDADWPGARGRVHAAVIADLDRLRDYDVYAAGPPAMIAAVRSEFGARGVAPDRLFFDSFDYAPELPNRHRTSASTKS